MAIDRSTLITGPAKVTQNGGTFFSIPDFGITLEKQTLNIATSLHGKVDERVIDIIPVASLTPEGVWNAANRAALWPYRSTTIGASMCTGTDLPFVAHGNDGTVHTIIASCLTKMPDIYLSAKKTMIGSAEWRGVRKNNTSWATADSLFSIASSAYSDTTFAPANIKVQAYTGVWGAITGFGAIDARDGWTIQFNLEYEPLELDSIGIIDYRFKNLEVMARCIPVGPTPTQILTASLAQGGTSARGQSLQTSAADLVITGADTTTVVTIENAQLKTFGYQFGSTVLRQGEIGFVATKAFTTGVGDPLFTLAGA